MASEHSKTPIDAASLFRVDGLVAFVTGGGTGMSSHYHHTLTVTDTP